MLSIIRSYVLAWLHGDRNPHDPRCRTRQPLPPGHPFKGISCNCRGRGKPLIGE